MCIVPRSHFNSNVLRCSCRDDTSRIMCCIVQAPDADARAACGIASLPDVTSRDVCSCVHALDAASRARDCIVDAPVTVQSELSMCVFIHDSTFTSTHNFLALTTLPRLCVALLTPLMPLPGLHVV